MELRAVIEALRCLPDGMHVWISMDSCYVKRGVCEWIHEWIKHNWKNSQRNQIANRSLGQKLVEESNRMAVVQWTWVKAHTGFLLNECADMLATKGVRNETPPASVQFLHPLNEDTDVEEYEFKDAELPSVPSNWTGDAPPPPQSRFTLGKLLPPTITSATVSALPPTSPFAVMLSDDGEQETEPESDGQPQPQSPSESDVPEERGPAQTFPTIVSIPTPGLPPRPKTRPTWWSEAWEMSDGIESEDPRIGYLSPMSGEEFRLKCESDVHAIDLYCSRQDEQNEENQVVGGVMWSDEAIILSVAHGKGHNRNEIHLQHLRKMLDCVPNGLGLTLHTTSEFLVEEREKFRGWVESGRIQDVWNQMNSDWKTILGNLGFQGKLIGIELWHAGLFQQQEAASSQRTGPTR
jgi:hypothetical protein